MSDMPVDDVSIGGGPADGDDRSHVDHSGLYYPNRFTRWLLLAMEEVMGKQGLEVVLEQADLLAWAAQPPPDTLVRAVDFAEIAALSEALEAVYGARGGRGLALRIGRATAAGGLKHFGAFAGLGDARFQALPLPERERLGLEALAHVFSHFTDQHTTLATRDDAYELVVDESPMAWERRSEKPVCHALAGMFQEILLYATGGYEFHIHETACRAAGSAACVFRVSKNPMGQR